MSDWNDRPAGLGALLDDARGEAPSPERLDRVRQRLEAELGVSLVPAMAPPGSTAPPPITTSNVVALLGAIATIGVILWLLMAGPETPAPLPPPPPEVPSVVLPAPHAPIAEPAPVVAPPAAEEPSAPLPRVRRAEATTSEPTVAEARLPEAGDGSTLREEIALLDRAITARDRGDTEAARAALELHRTRFPEGTLRPERERMLGELDVAPEPAASDPPPP